MSRKRSLALLLLAAASIVASAAQAQTIIKRPYRGRRPFQLDLHGGFAYVGKGLAVGARIGFPIVYNGFVKKINNAVYINIGADLYFIGDGRKDESHAVGIGVPITMHWEFYFTPQWSAFGEIGPNLFIHPEVVRGHGWKFSGPHWFHATAGGRFFIDRTLSLTLRIGSPYSSFGVTFFF